MGWLSILAFAFRDWRTAFAAYAHFALGPWIVLLLAVLGHGFLWIAIVNRLRACRIYRPLLDALTCVCAATCIALPLLIAWHATTDRGAQTLPLPADGAARWYVVACAIFGALSIILKWHEERTRFDRQTLIKSVTEIQKLKPANSQPLITGKLASLFRNVPGNQAGQIHIERKTLRIPNLPPELDGLRIVHLSDLHMTGRVSRPFYEHLTAAVNDMDADVIALTGDIVENVACWEWFDDTLNQMEARHGRYFVLGNHDFYIDTAPTIERLTSAGWSYAGGKWVRESWQGVAVEVVGNEMPWRGAATKDSMDPGASQALFRLALLHTPDQFPWSVSHGVPLSLAGHTHGGQICFPLLGPLASPSLHGTRFACGLFRRAGAVLHVSRGLGGKTPLRLNCGPELAVLELTA